jgi:high-affinity Fe2+/Pb2+ permease
VAVRHSVIEVPTGQPQGLRMSTKFSYALILTICGAVMNLLLYFTGFQTEKLATGQYFQWLGLVLMFVVLWLGLKAVREESPHRAMSYGKGVGSGVLIALYSGLMSSIYSFIHFKFVNPNFADFQIELIRGKWTAAGMTEAQMEQAERFTRMMMTPLANAIFTPIFVVVFGLICSLIIAAILKRNPPAEAKLTA